MELKEKIVKDLKEAFKKKEKRIVDTLKGLLTTIKNKEIENFKKPLEESQVKQLILKEIKKRKEARELYKKAQREDLVSKEEEEIEVLQEYLPEMLSPEEIRKLVKRVVLELERKDKIDFGRIMKRVIEEVKGRAEGQEVARIVREEVRVGGLEPPTSTL